MKYPRLLSVLLAVSLLMGTAGCNRSSKAQPTEDVNPVDFSSSASAEANLNAGTTNINLEGIDISVDYSGEEGSPITLEEYSNEAFADSSSTAEGNGYMLKDMPLDFTGKVNVTLTIPENVLSAYKKLKDEGEIRLLLGRYVYTSEEGGIDFEAEPYPAAVVDLASGTVSAEIDFPNLQASQKAVKLASVSTSGLKQNAFTPQWWETTPKNLFFKVTAGVLTNSTTVDIFTISFPKNISAGSIVDVLLAAKKKLESPEIGFKLDQPIEVKIKNCDTRTSKFSLGSIGLGSLVENDGMFRLDGLGNYDLCVNTRLLEQGDQTVLTATVSHELMHFAQYLVNMNNPLYDSFTSLDEATAVWFESYMLGDVNWMSDQASQQKDFIYSPWWFGDTDVARTGGYGASWFVDDLITNYGTAFIPSAYGSKDTLGLDAWRDGVKKGAGFEFEDAFINFLQAYLLDPASLSSELAALPSFPELIDDTIYLNGDSDTNDLSFDPQNDVQRTNSLEITSGWLNVDGQVETAPVISVTRSLNAMNGYLVNVSFTSKASDIFNTPRPLTISISGPDAQWTGAMVFGTAAGQELPAAVGIADAAAPLLPGASVTIPSFGGANSGAQYSRVAILFYNTNWASLDPIKVTATISYGATAKTYSGDAYATEWMYEEDVCQPETYCSPPLNPPQCYADYLQSLLSACADGGCGMGEGNEGEVLPCTVAVPEFCYSEYEGCPTCAGGKDFANFGRYNAQAFLISAVKAESDGTISAFETSWLEVTGEPQISGNADSFTVTLTLLDSTDQPKGHLILQGSLTPSGGGGTWTISHDCTGEAVKGTWSVNPAQLY